MSGLVGDFSGQYVGVWDQIRARLPPGAGDVAAVRGCTNIFSMCRRVRISRRCVLYIQGVLLRLVHIMIVSKLI